METYGCQMNVLDSELVEGQLLALGYSMCKTPQQADVVLLNTCSVRDLSEQKVWSLLGRLGIHKKTHTNLIIGILGCMAERVGDAFFKRVPHVDIVCGPANLDRLPGLLDNARRNKIQAASLAGHTSRRSSTLLRAQDGVETLDLSRATSAVQTGFQPYVRITRGCNKFCAFCVVPFTRGPEMHRAPEHIIDEVRRLVDQGAQEVTLIGQTVNHYIYKTTHKTVSFADLLQQVHDRVPSLLRLRFLTSYPRDFFDDALDVMAACPRICRFLHIPAQSGSNSVLKRMNRGYTVEAYLELLDRARQRMPDISLAGDMIVGFSGETQQDHDASVALLRTARYKSCFIFKYSSRDGTAAARRLPDDVPDEVKKARNHELLAVQQNISLAQHARLVGQRLEVLVQGKNKRHKSPQDSSNVTLGWHKPGLQNTLQDEASPWRLMGRTRGDEIVAFDGPGELVGQIAHVRAMHASPLTLFAELCA